MTSIDYSKVCFIVMPFGKKAVGNKDVDFDHIYEEIFAPAVNATVLPEGGSLIAKRTDQDFFSAHISFEMFMYIEYSRMTLADITGLNPNVFYELGVRHHAHPSGTAIFRQASSIVPFDINQIKAFPYEFEPEEEILAARQLITKVLTESLILNRLDSPVQMALAAQRTIGTNINDLLRDAENAIRHKNLPLAISRYQDAIRIDQNNPTLYIEIGVLHKRNGEWDKAKANFQKATIMAPTYGDAYRELGISQNKLYYLLDQQVDQETGEDALLMAIKLNSEDFDARASLGGVYKRLHRYDDALLQYEHAVRLSRGHSYPLLNCIKLRIFLTEKFELDEQVRFQLNQAKVMRRIQASNNPPFDSPWCFFDLSEIYLYLGDDENFIASLNDALFNCVDAWEAQTHLESLLLIEKVFGVNPYFATALQLIRDTIPYLRVNLNS